jgi:hypothetical protein
MLRCASSFGLSSLQILARENFHHNVEDLFPAPSKHASLSRTLLEQRRTCEPRYVLSSTSCFFVTFGNTASSTSVEVRIREKMGDHALYMRLIRTSSVIPVLMGYLDTSRSSQAPRLSCTFCELLLTYSPHIHAPRKDTEAVKDMDKRSFIFWNHASGRCRFWNEQEKVEMEAGYRTAASRFL